MINLLLLGFAYFFSKNIMLATIFLMISVIRYRFNVNKNLLYFSLLGNAFIIVLPYLIKSPYPVTDLIILNFILSLWGIYIIAKNGIWKKDIVLTIMDPLLCAVFISNLFGIWYLHIFQIISRWFNLFILLQLFLVIVKLYYCYTLTKNLKNPKERFKMVMVYLRHLNPSFGLNDFLSANEYHIVDPSYIDIIKKEVNMVNRKIFAFATFDKHELNDIKKEYSDFIVKNKIKYENIVSFKKIVISPTKVKDQRSKRLKNNR